MKQNFKSIQRISVKSVCLGIIVLFNTGIVFSQGLRTVSHQSFKRGEVLEYKASYGIIDAARAKLTIKSDPVMVGKRSTFHVVGTGKSLGAFNWLFKVEDRYESFIDDKAMLNYP